MTFEEMQIILGNVVQSQQSLEANLTKLEQNLTKLEQNLTKTEANIAKTEAIANSNARAIEAVANHQVQSRELQDQRYAQSQQQLVELIRVVGQIAESSDRRLTSLENRQ